MQARPIARQPRLRRRRSRRRHHARQRIMNQPEAERLSSFPLGLVLGSYILIPLDFYERRCHRLMQETVANDLIVGVVLARQVRGFADGHAVRGRAEPRTARG